MSEMQTNTTIDVLTQTRKEFEASRKQVFFVDSSVPGYELLVAGLGESGTVFTIDANSNALAQIAADLENVGGGVDGVHIYSHGRDGALQLGGQWIDTAALDASAAILARIGNALTANADILLYGCNVAKTSVGQSFVERVAALTRADVAASSDATGNPNTVYMPSGMETSPLIPENSLAPEFNWELEENVGEIETETVPLESLQGSLGEPDGDDGDEGELTPPKTPLQELMDSLGNGSAIQWGVVNVDGSAESGVYKGFHSNDIFNITSESEVQVAGGDGNDVYYVDNTTGQASIVEIANNGSDTVISRVKDFTLRGEDGFGGATQVEAIYLDSSKLGAGAMGQNATGNEFVTSMYGNALSNNLTGGGKGGVALYGYEGDDYLDAGDGKLSVNDGEMSGTAFASTLVGGKGNDNYIVRHSDDVITELANEGTDNVFATSDYALGKNIENLTLLNSRTKGTGNELNNVLKSTQGRSTLEGGAGNDTLYASQNGRDLLDGGAGNDAYFIYGNNNTITDSAGSDTIYFAYNGEDEEGRAFTLAKGNGIENLVLQGNANVGIGNELANRIEGNQKLASTLDGGVDNLADTLVGGLADDVFIVRSSNDMVMDAGSGEGGDSILAHATVDLNKFTSANIEHVFLQAGAGNISATAKKAYASNLVGNDGNNTLTGGDKDDTLTDQTAAVATQTTNKLAGGLGNDVYYVHSANTTITENANQGTDEVHAFVQNHTLAANVENLVVEAMDSAPASAAATMRKVAGNNLANIIDASAVGDNVIIHGGVNTSKTAGDTLIGGSGANQFYSYNDNDELYLSGTSNVIVIAYDDTEARTLAMAEGTTAAQWKEYFGERLHLAEGVELDPANVIYQSDPTKTSGDGAVIKATSAMTELLGTGRSDVLIADAQTGSLLDGKAGADSMRGSTKNDVFYVDNLKDSVDGFGGTDAIISSVNIDLTGADTKTANPNITGEFAKVELTGSATLKATGNADKATELVGNSGANTLIGGAADDILNGGAGADSMVGGAGNDKYYIDNASDKVVEKKDEGRDSIYSNGININLGATNYANVEYVKNESSTKGISMTGAGNGSTTVFAEAFVGNSGFAANKAGDTIDGKGGNDTITGGAGNDVIHFYMGSDSAANVTGGAGVDTLRVHNGGSINHASDFGDVEAIQLESGTVAVTIDGAGVDFGVTYTGNAGNNSLVGGAGSDKITGSNGQDTLVAGRGNDTLIGGSGNDLFIIGGGADTSNVINDGGDSITTGSGKDTVVVNLPVFAEGVTSLTTTLSDFVWGTDVLDDDALLTNGWSREADNASGKKTITYTKGDKTFVLKMPSTTLSAVDKVKQVPFDETSGEGGRLDTDLSGFKGKIVGTREADTIDASAAGGAVTILGNSGSDSIEGSKLNDSIEAGAVLKDDTLYVNGNDGNDTLHVTGVHDGTVEGGAGADSLVFDTIGRSSSAGAATGFVSVFGGVGNDTISIDAIAGGNVSVQGNAGTDTIKLKTVNEGNVLLSGNTMGVDTIAGGSVTMGADSEDAASTLGTSMTLQEMSGDVVGSHVSMQGSQNKDTFSIGNVAGGSGDLLAGAGNDSVTVTAIGAASFNIHGEAGADTIKIGSVGQGSNVSVNGGADNDSITVNSVAAGGYLAIDAGEGSNNVSVQSIVGTAQVTLAAQGNGSNSIVVGSVDGRGSVQLRGGSGVDSIRVNSVNDGAVSIEGGAGSNTYYVGKITGKSQVAITGGTGNDKLMLESSSPVTLGASGQINIEGVESVVATSGKDSIEASAVEGRVVIDGGAGNDTLVGGGALQLRGGTGDDLLVASNANEIMWVRGDGGTDTLSFEKYAGKDLVLGGGYRSGDGSVATRLGFDIASDGVVVLDDAMEVIALHGNKVTWNDSTGTKYAGKLDFSNGNNTLVIGDELAGGNTLNITGFGQGDSIEFDANAWREVVTSTASTVTYTYTHRENSSKKVTVTTNAGYLDLRERTEGQTLTVGAGATLYTTQKDDNVSVNLTSTLRTNVITNAITEVDDEGKPEGDSITVNASVTNASARITAHRHVTVSGNGINGEGDKVSLGGSNAAKVIISSQEKDGLVANVTQVGSYKTDITITDFYKLGGTTGADSVDATGVKDSTLFYKYNTNGGADTYKGGAGIDSVVVSNFTYSQAMNLDGGEGNDDRLKIQYASGSISLTVNKDGDIAKSGLKVGGYTSNMVASNFEKYALENTKYANTIDARAYTGSQPLRFDVGDGQFENVTVGSTYYGSNVGGAVKFESKGLRNDTYNLYATGGNTRIEDYGGKDSINLYGVSDIKTLEDLEKLTFDLRTEGGGGDGQMYTLTIHGLNGKENNLALSFYGSQTGIEDGNTRCDAMDGDKLTLYSGTSTKLLGGSIDMSSIVNALNAGEDKTGASLSFEKSASGAIVVRNDS